MAVTIPQFDSVVQGLGYANVPTPPDDAADAGGRGGDLNNGAPATMPATLTAVSIASKSQPAPSNPARWNSGDQPDRWMDVDEYK